MSDAKSTDASDRRVFRPTDFILKDKDPWKHRSSKMVCRTCMWYCHKASEKVCNVGRCHRHAPTMNGYPVVFDTDWCGDHKLNEEAIE